MSSARALVSDSKGPLLQMVRPMPQTIEPSRLAYERPRRTQT
ncbi:MAG TPA: hypothetical protein VJX23_12950 [Candidatus Binataceae bacterium]|nr:hypothetical protein [Candidatus Binataceae bacterium]